MSTTEDIMKWKKCGEHIRKVQKDPEKIQSLLEMAEFRLGVKIPRNNKTATLIVEKYYEVIKLLLVALMNKQGLASDNHECLISFFYESYDNYTFEAKKIRELKKIRNKIAYEGKMVNPAYLEKNELEFNHIIELLKELIQ